LSHVYKKLLFKKNGDSHILIGGMLVGDTAEYGKFLKWKREQAQARGDTGQGDYATVKAAMSSLFISAAEEEVLETKPITNLDLFRVEPKGLAPRVVVEVKA
jgi:hypothetical protein